MAALTKNAISVTVRDRAKRTKILDIEGYKSQITNIFKNSKFDKQKMATLTKNAISVTVRNKNKKYFQKFKFYKK